MKKTKEGEIPNIDGEILNIEEEILNIDGTDYRTRLSRKFRNRTPFIPADPFLLTSIIPGTILDILVKPGQQVKKGEPLIILEAMKMQNMLKSPAGGTIKMIAVGKGEKVGKGTVLLRMEQSQRSPS
ncbi:MAG: acetyl-CoA carboxylase biotin carboxyl carrier protein subunit [Bacteroidales bacterium]|nr:acetyl-CoA carboxylase biotin carboxyl carrier protein subunit [Bacteroidales bacterium]